MEIDDLAEVSPTSCGARMSYSFSEEEDEESEEEHTGEEQEEAYQPTVTDEALYASLLVGQIVLAIHNEYTAGNYTLATYRRLYEVARQAHGEVLALSRKLDEEEKSK